MVVQKSLLRMLVVQRLMDSPSSGYTIVKTIEARTGWKPSFGSIYPLLEKMQHDGLVTVKKAGRSKVYSLTAKGETTFEQQREQRVQAFSQIAEQMRVLECLGEDEAKAASDVLEILRRGEIPFQEIPEATHVKHELFRLLREGKTHKKSKEIRTILGRTLKELQRL